MRPSRALRALVPLAALGLALSACGGSGDQAAPPAGSAAPTAAGSTVPTTWPLTGLPAPNGSSLTKHPVYIAKIDNTYASDPQYGLSKADLVTEELVEGGITRLAVFFDSNLPDKAGPIRSMRLTDIGVAKPIGAQLVTSGAAPVTLAGLKKAGVTFDDMSNPNVRRVEDGTHDTLHSVVADIAKLGAQSKQRKPARPQDFMPWGTDSDFSGKTKATSIEAKFSGARTDDWKYTGGKYVLQNNYMASGDTYSPDTVIACMVKTSIAPYRDPAGNPVPVSHFEGKGTAMIFHDGKMEKATWVKPGEDKTVRFQLKNGKALKVPAGHVWLELIPSGGTDVSPGQVTWSK